MLSFFTAEETSHSKTKSEGAEGRLLITPTNNCLHRQLHLNYSSFLIYMWVQNWPLALKISSEVTCPRLYSESMAELETEARSPDSNLNTKTNKPPYKVKQHTLKKQ